MKLLQIVIMTEWQSQSIKFYRIWNIEASKLSKAQILILGGLRKDALTDLEKECDVTVGPDGHRLHDDHE